jgi:hypothetical protein
MKAGKAGGHFCPPGDNAELAAAIALSHQKVHRAVTRRVQELADGGLDVHEISAHTGLPNFLVMTVLRGAARR